MNVMQVSGKDHGVRIASYNIRKARGLDGQRNPGRIMDVINGLDADIVVLQEADRRLGPRPAALPARMIDENSDFDVVPIARNDVSIGWHGNAMLVKRGTEVSAIDHLDLPGAEPRGAVAVKLAKGLTVVGVHLGLLRRSRRQQLQTIVEAVDEQNTIIIGDMNEWSPQRGFEPLAQDYTLTSPGRSFHAARPLAALDRLALSHGVTLKDAGVEQTGKARRASDHLPIWADIAWRQSDGLANLRS